MRIMDDIIYTGVIEGMGKHGNGHFVKLTEENNCLACWEERFVAEQLENGYPKMLWYLPKFPRDNAIEKAVFTVDEMRHEKYEGGHAD